MPPTLPLPNHVLAALATLSRPRREQPDSFALHAQLEAMARLGLVPWLTELDVERTHRTIVSVAEQYAAEGELLAASFPLAPLSLSPARAERIALALSAAGHAPIGLHLHRRVLNGTLPASLLAPVLHEVDRFDDLAITWHRSVDLVDSLRTIDEFAGALRDAHADDRPASAFVYPVMHHAETSGVADRTLARFIPAADDPTWWAAAARRLTRAAAWSMLHDDPAHAPYGWTHCLTMPQAVLSMSPDHVPRRTSFISAATFVIGFRTAFGHSPLGELDDNDAVASAGSRPVRQPAALAAAAARHHDAHLVKYTLACIHAAEDDPAWAPVYLAAATALQDWWTAHPDAEFIG
jgi:hypothetical protein